MLKQVQRIPPCSPLSIFTKSFVNGYFWISGFNRIVINSFHLIFNPSITLQNVFLQKSFKLTIFVLYYFNSCKFISIWNHFKFFVFYRYYVQLNMLKSSPIILEKLGFLWCHIINLNCLIDNLNKMESLRFK